MRLVYIAGAVVEAYTRGSVWTCNGVAVNFSEEGAYASPSVQGLETVSSGAIYTTAV